MLYLNNSVIFIFSFSTDFTAIIWAFNSLYLSTNNFEHESEKISSPKTNRKDSLSIKPLASKILSAKLEFVDAFFKYILIP